MRWAVLAAVACVLLAGCAAPFAEAGTDQSTADEADTDASTAETAEPSGESGTAKESINHETRPDPESDTIGWENSYWHDDPVAVDASDGLNESERAAVVARAMARVEVIRDREFEESVNVTVVNRSTYGEEFGTDDPGETLRTFDNAKFEALFLIGNDRDSIAVQSENRNQSVAGFYSPSRGAIVLVSDSRAPRLDGERTLAHELAHALQDQQFNLSRADVPRTRDAYNAHNGLIEGDATVVETAYVDRCGEAWSCLSEASGDGAGAGGSSSVHLGVYVLSFFPYSDGPGLVRSLREGDDWSAVDRAFEDPPTNTPEVIFPERYGQFDRTEVRLRDSTSDGWERVRPSDRPDYEVIGPSGLTAMFAYTLYDEYNRSSVVTTGEFLNTDGGEINRSDPFEYAIDPLEGWRGDRLHVYERTGETGYVWRLVWATPEQADRFADRYRALVTHWGGEQVTDGVYVLPADSPFTGAVAIEVDGETTTIVGGPDRRALGELHRGVG